MPGVILRILFSNGYNYLGIIYLPNGGYDYETGKNNDCDSVWVHSSSAGLCAAPRTWWSWTWRLEWWGPCRRVHWRAFSVAGILRPVSLLLPLLQSLLLSSSSDGACGTHDLHRAGPNPSCARGGARAGAICILVLLCRLENLLSVREAMSRRLATGSPATSSSIVS